MGLSWSGKKDGQDGADGANKKLAKKSKSAMKRPVGILIVEKAMSSLFQDPDGDVADEFYEEVRWDELEVGVRTQRVRSGGRVKWTFRRVTEHLKPVGEVKLEIPRLHRDCPVVFFELNASRTVSTETTS